MKFKEIVARITGISVPICGISWTPPEAEVTVARRVLAFLEDRRVLYVLWNLEVPEACNSSVLEIRRYLTSEIQRLGDNSEELAGSLRAMRAACRKFLTPVPSGEFQRMGSYGPRWLAGALGELRGVFGVHIARLAAQYGLDVEDELAAILPAIDDERREPCGTNV